MRKRYEQGKTNHKYLIKRKRDGGMEYGRREFFERFSAQLTMKIDSESSTMDSDKTITILYIEKASKGKIDYRPVKEKEKDLRQGVPKAA